MEYQFLYLLVCYSITHSYTKLYNFLFSGNGFWPVQLVISNLPPNVRKYLSGVSQCLVKKAFIVVLNAKFMELVRNVLPQITKFMKLEYLHDYFTPLPKLKPIMGKIKKTVLLLDEIKAFDNIGIKVTEPILTFRVLKRMHDQLHSYNHKSVKNGSICEIEPGKNFISIKYFCQLPNNNTYALGYLFTNKDDVFYDTTTNDDGLPDLHLADSITHRFFLLSR